MSWRSMVDKGSY